MRVYAESEKLKDCIFLTENVNDFCNVEKLKDRIFEIHPDLQEDSKRFKIYLSPKELIEKESKTLNLSQSKV